MNYKEKVTEYFEGKVVKKDLTTRIKGNAVVPVYVLEYLLGQHCAAHDPEIIETGIEKVQSIIKNNFVHRSDAEYVKSIIRETRSHKIIDKISVRLNDRKNIYEANFTNLGIKAVPISDNIVKQHKKLLSAGVWCIITMGYSHAEGVDVRWLIENVKPIQVSGVDLDEYVNLREKFTSEEWLNLLMHSIGLKPEFFNRRGKLIQLSRLIPHVENNYNFIELGPKGTGKSHVFSELSPHGVLVSGGDVTKASLFIHNTRRQLGLVGYWDVVALDEFEQETSRRTVDGDLVKIMQNYMANQSFNRGNDTFFATASMVFVGNTKRSVPYMLKNSHLFDSIPTAYLKGAFLDRLHIYVPGWEVRILKDSFFSDDYGFIVDYLAEIFRQLRNSDFSSLLSSVATLNKSLTKRDKLAINKTFSGLAKIIYPNQEMTEAESLEILEFAIEGRKRIKDQLYIIDESFLNEPVNFSYTIISSGKEVHMEPLEKISYGITKATGADFYTCGNIERGPTPAEGKPEPQPRQITLRENQTGISYEKLFADYLRGAAEIILIDPYIRLYHQYRNFQEFCLMLAKLKPQGEEIHLHLITWNAEESIPDAIDNMEDISESVLDLGIILTYEFKNIHDRSIIADNGWKIVLGRGLDIFEKPEGKFNIAEIYQEKRQCKSCEITCIKSNDFTNFFEK